MLLTSQEKLALVAQLGTAGVGVAKSDSKRATFRMLTGVSKACKGDAKGFRNFAPDFSRAGPRRNSNDERAAESARFANRASGERTPALPEVTPPECYTIFRIGSHSPSHVVSRGFVQGNTRVREIQRIQSLALKLSQEQDPMKIAELIDEIRSVASTYVESPEARKDLHSAAGGV